MISSGNCSIDYDEILGFKLQSSNEQESNVTSPTIPKSVAATTSVKLKRKHTTPKALAEANDISDGYEVQKNQKL